MDLTGFTNKITYDVMELKDISNIMDFYKLIGLELIVDNPIDVTKVAMNRNDKQILHDMMIENSIKNRRGARKQREHDKAAWDWLVFSPEGSKDIPSGEVWYTDDYREE